MPWISTYLSENMKSEVWEDEPLPPHERRIAGSKRVARYQEGHKPQAGQLLQSITAQPALSTRSFEELRVECYAQSLIIQGGPPASVDPVATPGAVIPPLFNAYHGETDDPGVLLNEVTMVD